MKNYTLGAISIGFRPLVVSIRQIANTIRLKTKDPDVATFLQLPVTTSSGFEPSFIEYAILKEFNQSLLSDSGKDITATISKKALSAHGFSFFSRDGVEQIGKKIMAEVPQITDFCENGNGFDEEVIYFRFNYDSTIPIE